MSDAKREKEEAQKNIELYLHVTESLKQVEDIYDNAGIALKELRKAQKHLDFRMDQWLSNYEVYNKTQQRKVDNAYNKGYREARSDLRKELELEYEKKMNETLVKQRTRILSKRLVEEGPKSEPVVVNTTVLNDRHAKLPPNWHYNEYGDIIDLPLMDPRTGKLTRIVTSNEPVDEYIDEDAGKLHYPISSSNFDSI